MTNLQSLLLALCLLQFSLSSCEYSGKVIEEGDDPSFERGRSYLKVGRSQEALDEFLSVTRRITQAPKSHLEAGRLLLTLNERMDPVAAIYHFRRFLLLQPNSRESDKVRQLIVSAEREIIRKLPGEPYGNFLQSLELKERNEQLQRQVADLEARLGTLSPVAVRAQEDEQSLPSSVPLIPENESRPEIPSFYTVEPGDSLYGISRKIYGDSSYIDAIFQGNRNILKSKNSLQVGQTLRLPPLR
jgi:LysM repeat protein